MKNKEHKHFKFCDILSGFVHLNNVTKKSALTYFTIQFSKGVPKFLSSLTYFEHQMLLRDKIDSTDDLVFVNGVWTILLANKWKNKYICCNLDT